MVGTRDGTDPACRLARDGNPALAGTGGQRASPSPLSFLRPYSRSHHLLAAPCPGAATDLHLNPDSRRRCVPGRTGGHHDGARARIPGPAPQAEHLDSGAAERFRHDPDPAAPGLDGIGKHPIPHLVTHALVDSVIQGLDYQPMLGHVLGRGPELMPVTAAKVERFRDSPGRARSTLVFGIRRVSRGRMLDLTGPDRRPPHVPPR